MTSDHIDIQRRTLPVQCPACRDHLGAGPVVGACASCQTPHHLACLAEIGCASLQCRPYCYQEMAESVARRKARSNPGVAYRVVSPQGACPRMVLATRALSRATA